MDGKVVQMDIEQIEARISRHSGQDGVDQEIINVVAGLIARIKEARQLMKTDGIIEFSEKGTTVSPLVNIEKMMSQELRGWVKERPDLFGQAENTGPKREKFTGFKAV